MSISAISPIDGRYTNKTESLSPFFSEAALIRYRVLVEIKYFEALFNFLPEKTLSGDAKFHLNQIIDNFSNADASAVKSIEKTTNHDVKAVEYFLKNKLKDNDALKTELEMIHFALTSEDINNLAYALMLKDAVSHITDNALKNTVSLISKLADQYKTLPMLSRTHGQSATPSTLGKELSVFELRLSRQLKQLSNQEFLGKCGGATGGMNAHFVAYPDCDWKIFAKQFVENLGLSFNPVTTQIEPHDFIAELSHTMVRINTILLDLAKDIWHYISIGYFKQATVKGEVGSSTMPHKVNPIDFENAEGNLGLSNALFEHFALKLPISRLQRDLTDSTVLRSVGTAFAYSLIALKSLEKGLGKISANKDWILEDLNKHPEVLAEAVQTVMRRYQIEEPYEKLKAATRGQAITLEALHELIDSLAIPDTEKARLKDLNPATYI